ncbi:hypothetical protein ACKGJY_01950 [Hyunsoonleella sp. 2307UL5-6]|uniref:hypothetical protein n=1 Tax=Hyunsoonleella sp. 2307UL5-6 TaxID=3384768 RepID=UPI0039BCEE34
MIYNITLTIISLLILNGLAFAVTYLATKKKQTLQKDLSTDSTLITLNSNKSDTSKTQELAPTGS